MKPVKLEPDYSVTFDHVKNINEEILALLLPLLTAVENEAESDTYFMLRAVNRLASSQSNEITRLAEVLK